MFIHIIYGLTYRHLWAICFIHAIYGQTCGHLWAICFIHAIYGRTLQDIYGIIFLFLVKRLRSIDVISELQEYFLFPNFIKVYLPATKPAQQKM